MSNLNSVIVAFMTLAIMTATTSANMVIFEDNFVNNGNWSEFVVTGPGTISNDGDSAVFTNQQTGSNFQEAIYQLDTTISTLGKSDIQFMLTASQDNSNEFESVDYLKVLVDTGSGFTEVFSANGEFNAGTGFAGTLMAGPISIAGADNLADLKIRIEGRNSSTKEVYRIDNFKLTGVPEPTSLLMFGLALSGLAVRRRR